MDIKIRKYNDNDYDDVFKIIKEAFSCEKSKANSSFINEYVACLDGNIVGTFDDMYQAANDIGTIAYKIYEVIIGTRKTIKNYRYRYNKTRYKQ